MNLQSIPRFLFALLALATLPLMSACVVPDDASSDDSVNHPDWQSEQAPPVPQAEMPPQLDPQTQIWHPGYWAMEMGHFVWVPGKVLSRPAPTAVWNGAHWVQHTYGWTFVPGHWE